MAPDWTRFDLGARHRFVVNGTPLVARFNVEDVTGDITAQRRMPNKAASIAARAGANLPGSHGPTAKKSMILEATLPDQPT